MTVVWLSNDGSCFGVGIRQSFGARIMAVVLWWGYDGSLQSNYGSCFVMVIRQ
jgi:hypothetical protein